MSYDLSFKPRSGELDQARFIQYFQARPNYRVEGGQAWYANEDSGVYFSFGFSRPEDREPDDEEGPDSAYPAAFNINYFRPSYFILEAEPEVTAFVRQLDLTVSDPQIDGMGEGEYDREKLIAGWNKGNDFGYGAVLRDHAGSGTVASLPTARLMAVWRWNRDRQARQASIGESRFVPRIMFIQLDGRVLTAAVWPEAIPSVLPAVDCLIIPRRGPRRGFFGRRSQEFTIVAWSEVQPLLARHGSQSEAGGLTLDYETPPAEIVQFVQALPARDGAFTGLAADQVLDRELVEKYAA